MRIGLLSYEYPPETGFGGIGTYTWHHARGLRDLGHEVHVLAGSLEATVDPVRHESDGITVWRYRSGSRWMKAFDGLERARLWWTRNRLENGLSMHEGLKAMRREVSLDVLEMPECGAEGLLLTRLQDVPTVVKFHSPAELIMGSYDVARADRLLCPRVERFALNGATGYTSASGFLADAVRDRMGVAAPVAVVPNGIDLGWFDGSASTDVRTRFGIPRGRPLILFAGRMEPRKGIHLCEEIAGSILERHEAAFVFVGQDLFGHMEGTILPALGRRRLRGSVHHLGKLDLADVRSCLRESDIFLIPSLWENCPYSCLEAMAAGRAIVSSDAGGLPELVRDGVTGLVAPSEDAPAFIERIDRLLEDPGLRTRLGAAARAAVEERHTHVHIARATVAVYEAVRSGRAAPIGAETPR